MATIKRHRSSRAGLSPLEVLPTELLSKILDLSRTAVFFEKFYFMRDSLPVDPNSIYRDYTLFPALLVSRRLYTVAAPLLYYHVKIDRKGQSVLFLRSLERNPQLGMLVRSLYFENPSHESPECLLLDKYPALTPFVRDIFISCHHNKLQMITGFSELEHLETLVLEKNGGNNHFEEHTPIVQGISESTAASSHEFREWANQKLLNDIAGFRNLQVLDLHDSIVDDDMSFVFLHPDVRLRVLDLHGCFNINMSALVTFVTQHTATKDSLVVFNGDRITCSQDNDEDDMVTLLANAPATLLSLRLAGRKMDSRHIPLLQNLCGQLQELSIGAGFKLSDVETIVLGSWYTFNGMENDYSPDIYNNQDPGKILACVEFAMLKIKYNIVFLNLRQRLDSVLPNQNCNASKSRLRHLDISSLPQEEMKNFHQSVLLGEHSVPLNVIQGEALFSYDYQYPEARGLLDVNGWSYKTRNGMGWIER